MEIIKEIIEALEKGLGSIIGIATFCAICAIPFLISYFLIKTAVKNGVKEAIKETNLEKQIEKGTAEALRRIDYRVLARIFADEYKIASEKKEDT